MNEPTLISPALPYKDRKVGLVIFGILTILLGGLCALFVPLMIFGQVVQARTAPANLLAILPAVAMYGGLAVALVWLGIGSILARRWARALLLIFSWNWLGVGLFSLAIVMLMSPLFERFVPPGQPPEIAKVILLAALGMLSLMFVIAPGFWVLFYRSAHVKATCEARDPVVRWTDRCPLPVLGMSLLLGICVPMMLVMPLANRGALPLFGYILSGLPGLAAYWVLALVMAYATWAFYKLNLKGWWLIVAMLGLLTASYIVTFTRVDLEEFYRLSGQTEQQISQMRNFGLFEGNWMMWSGLIFTLPFLGYMLWVKKYFRNPASETP